MDARGLLVNIVAILVLLAVVFLSQQAYFAPYGKTVYLKGIGEFNIYWLKLNYWANTSLYPKLGGEAGKGRDSVTQEIVKHKNNIAQNIWENIYNIIGRPFRK